MANVFHLIWFMLSVWVNRNLSRTAHRYKCLEPDYDVTDDCESVDDIYEEAARMAAVFLTEHKEHVPLTRQQLLRFFDVHGMETKDLEKPLEVMRKMIDRNLSELRSKVRREVLSTGSTQISRDAISQPIERFMFDTLSHTWQQVKYTFDKLRPEVCRGPAIKDLKNWLENVQQKICEEYDAKEAVMKRVADLVDEE